MEIINTKYKSLGEALKCKNYGVFVNSDGEYCTVGSYYIKNNNKFEIIFSKGLNGGIATRPAIKSTSEKKILKVLNYENFILVD
jgi:hypothetical protein